MKRLRYTLALPFLLVALVLSIGAMQLQFFAVLIAGEDLI